MTYTILDVKWRTGGTGTVGIVAVQTRGFEGEWKAYIGVAPCITEESDAQFIAGFGAALSIDEAHAFFPQFDSTKYKES